MCVGRVAKDTDHHTNSKFRVIVQKRSGRASLPFCFENYNERKEQKAAKVPNVRHPSPVHPALGVKSRALRPFRD